MKLVTYRAAPDAAGRLGALVNDMVVDLERLGAAAGVALPGNDARFHRSRPLRRPLGDGSSGAPPKERWPVGTTLPAGNVRLLAPIPRLRKNIFGIGLNYVEHVEESSRSLDTAKDLPKQPVIFSKPPTSVIGPGEPIEHNARLTQQLDWEVELAVIMGRTARRIDEADALSHVFGYSVMIDISARDCRRAGQWIYSKGQDTFAPFGPCVVTADEIPDPHKLDLWLTVNGVEKQRSNTRHMLFKIPHLIADISAGMTLEPGDVIATGTPEGVGAGRSPQEWLWPGDVVVACVEGIGQIRHPVVAA
jgi:2-keto-4-pentenoate hydratase/2-oxohepta-3-ene-1,7-dioic acid hydratase in catechol pathway